MSKESRVKLFEVLPDLESAIRKVVAIGKNTLFYHGKCFELQHVNGREYRLTDEANTDTGIRWFNNHGNLSFFMA